MDKVLLKIFYFILKGRLGKTGVDAEQLNRIVSTKLLMDKRRVNFNWKQRKDNEKSNHLQRVLLMYALFGFFVGAFVFGIPNLAFAFIIFHAYILFMMAMTLITDFSSVMLDTTDTQIISPRPVNSQTLFMARMIHILIYILQFTIALAIFPLGVIFYKAGILVGVGAILTLLLTVLLAMFITYFLYLFLMRITSEQKVKEVITYFQIFMTIFFALGYQLLPRFINFVDLESTFTLHWYSWFIPPVWMAMTLDALYQNLFDVNHLLMITLAFVVPVTLIWVLNKYLAPSFARKLAASGHDTAAIKQVATFDSGRKRFSYPNLWSGWVTKNKIERASFMATWLITARDKNFKLKAYPSLAYIAIIIFMIAFKNGKPVADYLRDLPSTNIFLWFIYIPVISVGGLLNLTSYSEQFMASWVYYASPLKHPGLLITGALKSLIVKFFLPIYIFFFALCFYFWGYTIVDDFLSGLLNNLFLFYLFARFQLHYLPFSREPNAREQSGRFLSVIFQLILVAALTGTHYLALTYFPWLIYIMILPVTIGIWTLTRYFSQLSWKRISV